MGCKVSKKCPLRSTLVSSVLCSSSSRLDKFGPRTTMVGPSARLAVMSGRTELPNEPAAPVPAVQEEPDGFHAVGGEGPVQPVVRHPAVRHQATLPCSFRVSSYIPSSTPPSAALVHY